MQIKYDSLKNNIEYVGYYEMLNYIVENIDKFNYNNQLILIDKYIEIMKLIIEMEKGNRK